mgnify:CR=1 FL=1
MPSPRVHDLPATDATTVVGVIDAATPPVLAIESGDELRIETRHLWGGEIVDGTTVADLVQMRDSHMGAGALGPHTITGPVEVIGARPGDALHVEMLELAHGPHGYNLILPGAIATGVLAERLPEPSMTHYDLTGGRVELAPGLDVELAPFLGILGVAPAVDGPLTTFEPGPFGGNIDLRDLVEGTTLVLPVFRPGAGFYTGDAHALQGDGEVDQTALETTMDARLRLTLEPGAGIELPRALTADHVIPLAFDRDLDEAARAAVSEAVDIIAAARGIAAAEAYRLCSICVDIGITQLVNGVKGAHARIPRELLA